jgi:hypothetical protein
MMMQGVSRGTTSRVRPFASQRRSAVLERGFVPPSAPTADATPADSSDDLRTARGIVNGMIFAVPFWAMLGTLIWLLVAR